MSTVPDLLVTLRQDFGLDSFRPGQEAAIRRVLAGQHTLLVMPTGAGKSLAYQLPALLLPGLTLVISPLIALMKDQVDALLDSGLPATYINSSLPSGEQARRLKAMREGHVKLIYIAPERLRSNRFVRALANVRVSLLAVDEAHCVSQWGHDFRPDYLQIGQAWQGLGRPPLLATTATATPRVQSDILQLLGPTDAKRIVTGFNRPNLTYEVRYAADDNAKLRVLHQLLLSTPGVRSARGEHSDPRVRSARGEHSDPRVRSARGEHSDPRVQSDPESTSECDGLPANAGSILIYVGTRRAAEEVADFVRNVAGLPAEAYHAGLDPDLRHHVQNVFMNDRLPVVVATNAFGMGVDKPNIRAVIHYHIPATLEAFYQEAGRAGRDGLPARCALLFSHDDRRLQAWFIDSNTPTLADLRTIYALVGRVAQDGEALISRDELIDASGLHPVKVRVTLSELEQAGALLHLGDEAGFSRWRVLSPPTPRSREGPGTLEASARAIAARADHRRQLLSQMVAYAESDGCRRRYLLDYFGDEEPTQTPVGEPGCCDNCRTVANAADLPPAKTSADWIPLIAMETVRTLVRPVGRGRLAQILNGSRAREILRMGYDRHKFYGKLAYLSQERITALIDVLIETRYLASKGDELPVLSLTPDGIAALKDRVAIPLPVHLPSPPDQAVKQGQGRAARPTTVGETLALHRQGLTPVQIAEARERSVATIYGHLARLITDGELELENIVAADVIAQVRAVVEEIGGEYLSPIKQRLPDTISYAEIQCVIAGLELSGNLPESKEGRDRPGKEEIPLHLDRRPEAKDSSGAPPVAPTRAVDEALFELLRQWRTAQAREQRVPPYVIFHDRVLRAIAANLPTDPEALRAVPGVGPAKLERYGPTVLAIVQAYLADTSTGELPAHGPRTAGTGSQVAQAVAPSPPAPERSVPTDPITTILAVVADLPGVLSRSGLAKLLTGSQSTRVAPHRDHPLYGALQAAWGRQDLTDEIDRLIKQGLLVNRQGRLLLSPTAQTRLKSPRRPNASPDVEV